MVSLVGVDVVRPLRGAVLRPGLDPALSIYEGDDHPLAAHVACRLAAGELEGEVVAVGSLLVEAAPWDPGGSPAWRIRGMATARGRRSQGYGRAVLQELLAHAAGHGGWLVWCNARVSALGFYVRADFVPVGEPFELPGIGPHQAMQRSSGPPGP